ncbi:hypothetical protein QYF61_014939 [Mycteria americana]|uniref:Uncharacterized protein n=1 Tax=Mycteria americana TaxID=33587 RepID=A0AAN7MGL0_MYCAM|nr:hypothetical protein QYF61_014939 [Mycteria americana]
MSQKVMWKHLERSVEIQIANKTQDVTLYNPRSYCYSGYSSIPPSPRIPPNVRESCCFTNSMLRFRGCVGLLVYEADTFTLAILFSNPFDYNIFYMELAMEISPHKAHLAAWRTSTPGCIAGAVLSGEEEEGGSEGAVGSVGWVVARLGLGELVWLQVVVGRCCPEGDVCDVKRLGVGLVFVQLEVVVWGADAFPLAIVFCSPWA